MEDAGAQKLFEILCSVLSRDGRIRAEDLIVAAASVTAELCISGAGEFDPRRHDFVPGSRVFSDKVNELISGNSTEIETAPSHSVVGILRNELLSSGYASSDFGSLREIYSSFAANPLKPDEWVKIHWSVPEGNRPYILPLRVAYEARPTVDSVFRGLNPSQRLRSSVMTLVKVLVAVRDVIDKRIALLLALETINGMAKTAPMPDNAIVPNRKQR